MNTDAYFRGLGVVLKKCHRPVPSLVVDLDRLDKNINTLLSDINPQASLRIVVKSLPSLDLLNYVMPRLTTNRLMVFHQPFLTDLSSSLDEKADVLMGKPMPIQTAKYYYFNLPQSMDTFDPYRQVQWLVDTKERLVQYIQLASELGKKIRLNLELDTGLHRGGFSNLEALEEALAIILKHTDDVEFSGLLGYDPHVVKIPRWITSQKKLFMQSNVFYEACKALIKQKFPTLWNDMLTYNGAGSPTLSLHKTNSPLNDIAAGSCLVMPTTFDIESLKNYEPACFIATPILKKFDGTTLPALEKLKPALNWVSAKNRKSFFIYGGYWKADYCYPKTLQANSLFGVSTNQTMVNAKSNEHIEVDDFVFLRPHQSEFVFLQFGEILAIRGHELVDRWKLLKNT